MEELFKCELCSEEFGSLDKLILHQKHPHEGVRRGRKKNFKCNVCGYKCSSGQHLTNHVRTHTGERPFKCELIGCEMAFKQESSLKTHIKTQHSDEHPFKCDFPGCRYIAKTTSYFNLHKKVHKDERPFACSECSFRAKRKDCLLRHTATIHSGSKTFTCSKCNFKTNSAQNLASHMIVHEGRNEKLPCSKEGCGYKGKNKRALKWHMRHHKTLWLCPVAGCGQARHAPTRKDLKDHQKLHKPLGRPFQCPFCFKHFRTLDQLQQHCVAHTNEKPFQCGHCELAASSQSNVKRHISSVHADVDFPFIIHLADDRECLHCKITLPSEEFLIHSMTHGVPVVLIGRLQTRCS